MKRTKTILMILCMAFVSVLVGNATTMFLENLGTITDHVSYTPVVSLVIFGLAMVERFALSPNNGFRNVAMAITQEFWVNYIVGNLFKDNSVLSKVFREDDRVLAGSVVHIPAAGAKPGVTKNRTVFPAVLVRRTDTDITYPLDVYSTEPTHLTNAELTEISYEKIDSVLGEHMLVINDTITDEMLYTWAAAAAGQIARTTGADSADNLSPSATGTRKILTVADFKKAMLLFNKQNIAKDGRFALLESDMYGELLADPLLTSRDVAKEADYKEGRVARLFGFDIMERSLNTIFTNAATPVKRAVGAAAAASDNKSSLFFQKNSLALALGSVKFFETLQSAEHYGDIYSAEIKCGGRIRRPGAEGVLSIVQTVGA